MKQFQLFSYLVLLFFLTTALTEKEKVDSIKQLITPQLQGIELVDTYNNLAITFGTVNIDSSISYSSKAAKLAKEIDYPDGLGLAHIYAARANIEIGNIQLALENFDTAIVIFETLQDSVKLLNCYRGMSYVASYNNSKLKALEYSLKALDIINPKIDSANFSILSNNIGTIYQSLENYDKAIDYFQQSLVIEKAMNNVRDQAVSYSNIGMAYIQKKDYKAAEENYLNIKNLLPEIKSDYMKAFLLFSIGRYHNAVNQIDSSEYYLNLSNTICEEQNLKHIKIRIFKQKGILRFKQERYNESIECFDNCIEQSILLGITEELSTVFQLQADAYAKIGNYKEAHALSKKAIVTIDSLQTSKISQILDEYEERKVKNQLKQKDLQLALLDEQHVNTALRLRSRTILATVVISLLLIIIGLIVLFLWHLNEKNKLLKRQHQTINHQKKILEENVKTLKENEKNLKKLNHTKDKFFSIIAHDLRAPFNSILGFSELLSVNANSFTQAETKAIADNVYNSSKQAFSLLENLLSWAQLQAASIKANKCLYDSSELVKTAIENYESIAKFKEINLQGIDHYKGKLYIDPEMINAVIRNLINNAIKFTHKKGHILLEINKNSKEILFSVSDNGIGISEENKAALFQNNDNVSTHGTHNEKGSGLGLILCKEFLELHNGKIWVESRVGEGSSFKFTIPYQ